MAKQKHKAAQDAPAPAADAALDAADQATDAAAQADQGTDAPADAAAEVDPEREAFVAKLTQTHTIPTISSTVARLVLCAGRAGNPAAHAALYRLEMALAGVKQAVDQCDGVLPADAAAFVDEIHKLI